MAKPTNREAEREEAAESNARSGASKRAGWANILLPPAIIVGSLLAYVKWGHQGESPDVTMPEPLVPTVTTQRASTFDDSIEIEIEGIARPFRRISVATEIAGRIRLKTPACQEANFVKKGELLLEIDPLDYEIAVRRFDQELKQSEAALKEWEVERANTASLVALAEQDERLAERDLDRSRKLLESGGGSQATLEQAQRAQLTARNALVSLQNQIRLLDARYARAVSARDLQRVQLERAQRDLTRTKIYAPCDGTIVTESVEQDGYAQAGATLVEVNDTSAAEVVCQLELSDMYWLWGTKQVTQLASADSAAMYEFPRWPVTIEFPVEDLVCQWDGEMVRYGGEGLNLSTRTVPCQIHVAHPRQGRLLRTDGSPEPSLVPPPLTVGMFVTVRARVKPNAPLLEIPNEAYRAGEAVWVVRDGKLHVATVKMARREADRVLVYSSPQTSSDGLHPGDKIITSPLALVQEGMTLREVTQP